MDITGVLESILFIILSNIGYVVILLIALAAVWVDHRLSDKSSLRDGLNAIKSELHINQDAATGILTYIRDEIGGESLSVEYPRFRTSAFDSFRNAGLLVKVNNEFESKLVDAYFQMSIIDGYSRRRDEMNFGLLSVMINLNTGQPAGPSMRNPVIEFEAKMIREKLQPLLDELAAFPVKRALDRKVSG